MCRIPGARYSSSKVKLTGEQSRETEYILFNIRTGLIIQQ